MFIKFDNWAGWEAGLVVITEKFIQNIDAGVAETSSCNLYR